MEFDQKYTSGSLIDQKYRQSSFDQKYVQGQFFGNFTPALYDKHVTLAPKNLRWKNY